MPLFVQLADKKGEAVHHRVESYETVDVDDKGLSSLAFKREYKLGCGQTATGPAHALYEAEEPAWTGRHVAKGCFTSAADAAPAE